MCIRDSVYMLGEAMKRAGSVDDVAKVKQALMSFTYNGVWNIRYDKTGEAVFGFDMAHMKKGGAISLAHIEPK